MTTINTYSQLIEFIRANNLSIKQTNEIITASLNVIVLEDYNTKEDLLKAIETYWNKWKNIKERPIFIGLDMDVKD
jgi:hypothetical protein